MGQGNDDVSRFFLLNTFIFMVISLEVIDRVFWKTAISVVERSAALIAALCEFAVIEDFLRAAGIEIGQSGIDNAAIAAAVVDDGNHFLDIQVGAVRSCLRRRLNIGMGRKGCNVQDREEAGGNQFVPVHGDFLRVAMGGGVRQVVLPRWNPFNRPEVSAMCRKTGRIKA